MSCGGSQRAALPFCDRESEERHRFLSAYNADMTHSPPAIRGLRNALASGVLRPSALAEEALGRANHNPSHNTYLWQNAEWTRAEAVRAEAMPRKTGGRFGDGRANLWGLPVSVKDCFNLAGAPTTCGAHFYRDMHGIAAHDSELVEKLRAAGAVIVGKTHLHTLAYGITGENPDYGDCIQPGTPGALTGGSSSGAAASVMENSAVAAIGTDTGGSVRVPASLCGLAGYRSTIGRGDWRGGMHLAESFDTIGWLFRDLEDAPLLAEPFARGAENSSTQAKVFGRFAYVVDSFLHDCEPEVKAHFHGVMSELRDLGLEGRAIDPEWWAEAVEIFAPLQAAEAAKLHAGTFEREDTPIRDLPIRDRLRWGASLSAEEIDALWKRQREFCARMKELFAQHELIVLPCAPVARLNAGADQSQTRARLLRYTAPFSLPGVPAIAVPCAHGGVQIAAARERDEDLLGLAARIGARRRASAPA
jgi:Asp-tRNA(Asn)/Glu-tRNA(Gln) amidotransferase A subunit family amidase